MQVSLLVWWQEAEGILKWLQIYLLRGGQSMSKIVTIKNERKLISEIAGIFFVHSLCACWCAKGFICIVKKYLDNFPPIFGSTAVGRVKNLLKCRYLSGGCNGRAMLKSNWWSWLMASVVWCGNVCWIYTLYSFPLLRFNCFHQLPSFKLYHKFTNSRQCKVLWFAIEQWCLTVLWTSGWN